MRTIQPPTGFWLGLERIAGRAAVEAEWRSRVGDDFDRVRDLLRADAEPAASVPHPERRGTALAVVDHGDGEIVGVCPDGGGRFSLAPADLTVYRVAMPTLLRKLAALFGVAAVAEPVAGIDGAWLVGIDRPRAGFEFPLFLILSEEPRDYRFRVAALLALSRTPFRLLAPTNHFHRLEAARQLEAHGSAFLALAGAVVDTQSGWRLNGDAAAWFSEFRTRHMPGTTSRDRPTFPTPAGATWPEVQIRFLDGERVTIAVRDVVRTVNYSQMGLADGRSGKPKVHWKLLGAFADGRGTLDWTSPEASRKNQKRRENLSKALRAYFQIEGDPIELTSDGKSWRTLFRIDPDT